MSHQNTVLILQGGGALGAYQAGVYQQLHEKHTPIEWVIGTSIGAINAALIAGNPPETRMSQLKGFWDSLAPSPSHDLFKTWAAFMPWLKLENSMNTIGTMMHGVDGFFKPRHGKAWDITTKVPMAETGIYDTSPLKTTLEAFVDFDYLNKSPIRLSVCAVDIDSGQSTVFDSKKIKIQPEHIMASGALPPGFPPIEIEGRSYWDGGIYSNSPLDVFLEYGGNRDALCFMVDLWDPTETRPESIAEALARYKSIQYASRSKEQLAMHRKIQHLQRAIRVLSESLPEDERKKKSLQPLIGLGSDHTVNVVHLIMKALPGDNYFKDIDFSAATVEARWQAGITDCKHALKHQAWLKPLPPHAGLIIHELVQQ
ncbi:MAG TPA: patatin-like phospholipase family protein [Burkholderiaceae bacterium]|jgi:NTE family protein